MTTETTQPTENAKAPEQPIVTSPSLIKAARELFRKSDFDRWYWYSYGEKCYAFAVDCCVPKDENVSEERTPAGGSRLWFDGDGELVGKNDAGEIIPMMLYEGIMTAERQNGDAVCRFIAEAHEAMMAMVRSS